MRRSLRISRLVLVAAALLLPRVGAAQQYLLGASGEVASGVEGGTAAGGFPSRTRTRIRLGADLRVDEFPKDIFGAGLLVEVEPHASFGIDVRYMRRVGKRFEVNAGGIGYLAPATLFGPSAGFKYLLPLSSASAFTVGPELNVFVLGGDLPDGTIIWQGLLQAGIHADL